MSKTTFDRPKLYDLIALFYEDSASLGRFQSIHHRECPSAYRALLAHSSHMTVTVEKRHGQLVDVEILQESKHAGEYRRKILLRRQSDRKVVQFGIVRMNLNTLATAVQQQIMAGEIPLGRILIQNELMREVQLSGLWQVECGLELAGYFQVPYGCVTYGRTARILVDSVPMIELLEIVAPEPDVEPIVHGSSAVE